MSAHSKTQEESASAKVETSDESAPETTSKTSSIKNKGNSELHWFYDQLKKPDPLLMGGRGFGEA